MRAIRARHLPPRLSCLGHPLFFLACLHLAVCILIDGRDAEAMRHKMPVKIDFQIVEKKYINFSALKGVWTNSDEIEKNKTLVCAV